MTIVATASEIAYAGDGVTLNFPIPFPFDTSADLKLTSTDSSGNITVLSTGFAITGGAGSTGNAIFTTAPIVGVTITILDNPAQTQPTDYVSLDAFPAESHERALDRVTRIAKRLNQLLQRALRFSDGDPSTDGTLGSVANRKGKYLFFNAITGAVEYATAVIGNTLSQSIIGQFFYPQSGTESGAGVTPVSYFQPYGEVLRDGTNPVPGTTNVALAFQAAIDSADDIHAEVYIRDDNALGRPLLIRTTSQQNIAIVGNGRVSTILRPTAADIKVAPVSINALIINQNNNTHLHLSKFRCLDAAAYTGKFLYALEGGGTDASGQALFSAVVDDCWFGFSSNNSGIFHGGFSNLRVSKCVFESTKTGCFLLEGAGNSDQQYIGNVMNACFDSFIYAAADTQTKAMIMVNGLHAYQHLRGPLIEMKNGKELIFTNIILEPDAANVGSTGLFKLTDCIDVLATNFYATTANGEPACAVGIDIINACTGKFANGKIAAAVGLRFSGTGALDLTFDNLDFTACTTAAVQWLSGTLSGKIRFRNCKFNDSQLDGLIVSSGTMSWDLTIEGGELMNAGLGASATSRNMVMTTSGKVRLIRVKIGQDNAAALAAYFIKNTGAGTFEVIDPILVGAAPTGFNDGATAISLDGVDSSMPNMTAFTPSLGGNTTYTTQTGGWSLKNKMLTFWGRITVNVIGTGSANTISGLPFTVSTLNGVGHAMPLASLNANVTSLFLLISASGTSMTLKGYTAAAAAVSTINGFANSTDVLISGSYKIA